MHLSKLYMFRVLKASIIRSSICTEQVGRYNVHVIVGASYGVFTNNVLNTFFYLFGFFQTAVAIFRKTNAIPLCFSIDLVLIFLLSWLLVLLPFTFFLDSSLKCIINRESCNCKMTGYGPIDGGWIPDIGGGHCSRSTAYPRF